MRPSRRHLFPATVALAVVACAGGGGGDGQTAAGVDTARGQELFGNNCAVCHGEAAVGTAAGPPLVHEIYEPSHHDDASFQRAVQEGVAPHHWEFGPMPAIGGLDTDDVADITAYVRELQRAAGIE